MNNIKFITSNRHKFEELSTRFRDTNIQFTHYKYKYTEMQADSIYDVVISSASQLATIFQENFLIEDSGLSIDALNDFPGPYSSYVFQTIGWKGILELMKCHVNRAAYFTSIFALYYKGRIYTFEGKCPGIIADQGHGDGGFGFDPIFIPDEGKLLLDEPRTFAEIELSIKNSISHRGKSMELLLEYFSL